MMAAMTGLTAALYLALPPLARGRTLRAGEIGLAYARASLLAVTSTIILMLLTIGLGLTLQGAGAQAGAAGPAAHLRIAHVGGRSAAV